MADKMHILRSISKVNSDVLGTSDTGQWSVRMLEQALLDLFPAFDAEEWDRTGLVVGDPTSNVTGVAIALDAHEKAVEQACSCGANVLLTHHPVYLEPCDVIGPAQGCMYGPGSVVWQAIRSNVALVNFHTALDVSTQAQKVLPSMLGLRQTGVLSALASDREKGYGQVCAVDSAMTLEYLAARCTSVFGRLPRTWGAPGAHIETVVTATGSAGNLLQLCIEQRIDCLVCGELRYHDALDASQAGLCIIELGHDVSELPLCAVLAAALEQVGFPGQQVTMLDQSGNWWTPEATRR